MMNNTSEQDQASSSARASPAMRRQGRFNSPPQESQQQQQTYHHQYPAGSIHQRMSPPTSGLPTSLQHSPSAYNGADMQAPSHAHLSPSQSHYNVQQHEQQQYSYALNPNFDSEEERRETMLSSHSHRPLVHPSPGSRSSEGNVSCARYVFFFFAFEMRGKKAHRKYFLTTCRPQRGTPLPRFRDVQ